MDLNLDPDPDPTLQGHIMFFQNFFYILPVLLFLGDIFIGLSVKKIYENVPAISTVL
jgi:hypothetical protein